jgi:hypothetical protein
MSYEVRFCVKDDENLWDALNRVFGVVTPASDPVPPETKTRKPRKAAEPLVLDEPKFLGADAPAPMLIETPAPEPEPVVITKADVMGALKNVMNGPGVETALKLLGEFGAQNVSGLKVEDYPVFVAQANTMVLKHGATLAS